MKEEKEKPKYNIFSNVCYMSKKAWTVAKSVLVFTVLVGILNLLNDLLGLFVVPVILQKIETHAEIGEFVISVVFFVGGLMITGALLAYLNAVTLYGRIDVRRNIILDLNDKFLKTSYENTLKEKFRNKFQKACSACNGNQDSTEAIWGNLSQIIQSVFGFLIFFLLLSNISPILVSVIIVTSFIGFFVRLRIDKWRFSQNEREGRMWRRLNYLGNTISTPETAKDIRIFGMKEWLTELYEKNMQLFHDFYKNHEKHYYVVDAVDVVLTFLRNGIAYFYLIHLVLNNGLSAAEFILYFSGVGSFTTWLGGILHGMSVLHKHSNDISIVREVLEYQEPFCFSGGISLPDTDMYSLSLIDVSYHYEGSEEYILKNINLTIEPGENLAVVGLNGSGKTTLIKIICGLIDPTEGKVLLNGIDIRKINRRDYYEKISAVFQTHSMLSATIAQNISQTVDGYDMDRIKDSARRAGISEKIERFDNQYETYMGKEVYEDAVELSGGELQKLLLARALYKGGKIILLDEPTAALDPLAEEEIYNHYRELTNGCTSIYISHRLASTRFCDRIILLENAKILEEGTHEQLMEKRGRYAEIFHIQGEYYKNKNVIEKPVGKEMA